MGKRIILFFSFILFSFCSAFSQNTKHLLFNSITNIVNADFTNGAPIFNQIGFNCNSWAEGINHQEDGFGNIIFWVDSNGVYDENNNVMPGSVGIDLSNSQTEVEIAPFPGNASKYFIIYLIIKILAYYFNHF